MFFIVEMCCISSLLGHLVRKEYEDVWGEILIFSLSLGGSLFSINFIAIFIKEIQCLYFVVGRIIFNLVVIVQLLFRGIPYLLYCCMWYFLSYAYYKGKKGAISIFGSYWAFFLAFVFVFSRFMVQKLFSLIDQTSAADNPDSLQNQEVLLPGHLIAIYLKVDMRSFCFKIKKFCTG